MPKGLQNLQLSKLGGGGGSGNPFTVTITGGFGYIDEAITFSAPDVTVLSQRWFVNGVQESTAATYTPTDAQDMQAWRLEVDAAEGTARKNGTVRYRPAVNTVPPVQTGGDSIDDVVTLSQGTWTGENLTYTYNQTNGITTETDQTFDIELGDSGTIIAGDVTATNSGGSVTVSANNFQVGTFEAPEIDVESTLNFRTVEVFYGEVAGNPRPTVSISPAIFSGDGTAGNPWLYTPAGGGAETVNFTVTATNGIAPDQVVSASVDIPAGSPPVVESPIGDRTIGQGLGDLVIDLNTVYSGASSYSVTGANASVASNLLTLSDDNLQTDVLITVTGSDAGQDTDDTFLFTVGALPSVITPADFIVQPPNGATNLGLSGAFDFYIDDALGNDSNDGSVGSPWASLNKIDDAILSDSTTVRVLVKSGTYDKASDVIIYSGAYTDAVLDIVFEPGCIVDGTAASVASSSFFSPAGSGSTANVYGNGCEVRNFTNGTGNGLGGTGTVTYNAYNFTVHSCIDGLSVHDSTIANYFDCEVYDCTKANVAHISTTQTTHTRCVIRDANASALNPMLLNGQSALFNDCQVFESISGEALTGTCQDVSFGRCQLGTISNHYSLTIAGAVIADSFVSFSADTLRNITLTRCFGLLSMRQRAGGSLTMDGCVIVGSPTANPVFFSNFDSGGGAPHTVTNCIFETSSFMSYDGTNSGYLVSAGALWSNNILNGGAAFDADLVAADVGGTVIVDNLTADPLIGSADTLLHEDYAYADGSPAVGAGTGGGVVGFPVGSVLSDSISFDQGSGDRTFDLNRAFKNATDYGVSGSTAATLDGSSLTLSSGNVVSPPADIIATGSNQFSAAQDTFTLAVNAVGGGAMLTIDSIGTQQTGTGDVAIGYSIDANDPTVEGLVYLSSASDPVQGDFGSTAGDYIDLGTVNLTTDGSNITVAMPSGLQGTYKTAWLPTGATVPSISGTVVLDTTAPVLDGAPQTATDGSYVDIPWDEVLGTIPEPSDITLTAIANWTGSVTGVSSIGGGTMLRVFVSPDIPEDTGGAPATSDFIIQVMTTGTDETFTLPHQNNGTFNYTMSSPTADSAGQAGQAVTAWNDANTTITFPSAGTHTITCLGTMPNVYFNNDGDRLKLVSVDNLGVMGWTRLNSAFYGCSNLITFTAGNTDTSAVTDMQFMMFGWSSMMSPPDLTSFNTSSVTNMSSMMRNWSSMTSPPDLSGFDTSAVTNMNAMMRGWSSMASGPSIAGFNIEALNSTNDLTNILDGAPNWGTTWYDAVLNAWAAQTVFSGMAPNFGANQYSSAGQTARTSLINAPNNWTITDGGLA